jgi:hypothetical protein
MLKTQNIITNRLLSAALTIAFAAALLAHGGFDHVIGTVTGLSGNVLTVKTAKGNVDVKVDEKTEISRNDQKAETSDLKPGVRVVVDIPEGSKDRVAHSVKIGTARAASRAEHTK